MEADSLELAIAALPYFRELRLEERGRVASQMAVLPLIEGDKLPIGHDSVLLMVLQGSVELTREGEPPLKLGPGDWTDDPRALGGKGRPGSVRALSGSSVATLDHSSLDHLFEALPVVALPFLAELGRELKGRNDLLRDVSLARSAGLPPAAFRAVVSRRRRRLQRHRHVSLARIGSLLWRALLAEPSRRFAFWVFVGAVLALVVARTVVSIIIQNNLQKSLFALIESQVGHPVHVHHFNYGLMLLSLVGALALWPRTRKALRFLAFLLGFGVGLVVDEFALFWNLNPDYNQPLSRLAAGLVVFALFQAVYFRNLYLAVFRRLLAWARP